MEMKPAISSHNGGHLFIGEQPIENDFIINSEGKVIKREINLLSDKDLKVLNLDEACECYDPNINEMIIGSTEDNKLRLSNEATDFFEEKRCKVKLLPLQEAVTYWNRYEGHAVGLFHLAK
jgi:hypothetical protein